MKFLERFFRTALDVADKKGNKIQQIDMEGAVAVTAQSAGELSEKRGALWMTRADHLKVNSSPPIDPKFGDNVCKGDTLSNRELAEFYAKELKGIRSILSLPHDQRKIISDGSSFLDPNYLSDELDYYKKRGMDVFDGEVLLEELKSLG